jgi:tetratricopeptide (TPR) repeat protein
VQHFGESVRLDPDNSRYHYCLACCSLELGRQDIAGNHFEISARLDPRFGVGHSMLGMWFIQQGMLPEALHATGKGVGLDPENGNVVASHAWALEAAGENDAAWEGIEALHARGDRSHAFVRLFARMGRWRGRQVEALELVLTALNDPTAAAPARSELHFAAADLLDSLGRYDEAFEHASHGNKLRQLVYDRRAIHGEFERMANYFNPHRLRALPKASNRCEKPVFIVGMPRSGTSLVEQILASHPNVYGAGELDVMYRTCMGAITMLGGSPDDYPGCLDDLSLNHANGLAHIYLGPVNALHPAALRITDKMPLNFYHLGLISLLMPGARIIHCRRNPMDTCLSCYMSHFSVGNDFKYDLTDLGFYHRDYQFLMSHWKSVLDLPILDVDYEHIVTEPEAESRRMIDFLELPWDERCLRPHETRRPTATASVQQVRQPIYRSSVERWRRYEKFLRPLQHALNGGDAAVAPGHTLLA